MREPPDGDGPGRLFVYGTLRPSAASSPARRRLESGAELEGRARMRGRLYEVPSRRFPAAVRAGDGWVHGALYRLRRPARLLPALDRYEGRRPEGDGLYRREVVPVESLEDGGGGAAGTGRTVHAWTYLYNRDVGGLRQVEGGDWLAR